MNMEIFWAFFLLSIGLLAVGIVIGVHLSIKYKDYKITAYLKFDTKSIESKIEGNFGALILWVGFILILVLLMLQFANI